MGRLSERYVATNSRRAHTTRSSSTAPVGLAATIDHDAMSVEEAKFEQNVKPRLARSTRWVLRALGALLVLAVVYAGGTAWALGRRRAALLERRSVEAAGLAAEERGAMDDAAAFAREIATAATSEEPGPPPPDGQDALACALAGSGLWSWRVAASGRPKAGRRRRGDLEGR